MYSCGTFSLFLNIEAAVLEAEYGTVVLHKNGEDLLLFRWVFSGASINKDILFSIMPVNVTAKPKLSLLFCLFNKELSEINGGMCFLRRFDPLPIQISTRQVAPIVTDDDSIDVEHRNNFKYEIVSQVLSCRVVTQQKLDYVLYDIRGHSLAWVHSWSKYNCLFVF